MSLDFMGFGSCFGFWILLPVSPGLVVYVKVSGSPWSSLPGVVAV